MHTNTTYAIYWLPTARNTSRPVVGGTPPWTGRSRRPQARWDGATGARSYQWQRCSSTGTSCVDITGATAATYKLTIIDGGHVVAVDSPRRQRERRIAARGIGRATAMVIDVPALEEQAAYLRPRAGREEACGWSRLVGVFAALRPPVAALQRARWELLDHR